MKLLLIWYVADVFINFHTLNKMLNDKEFVKQRPEVESIWFFIFGICFSFLSWAVIFLSWHKQTKAIKRGIDEIRKNKIS